MWYQQHRLISSLSEHSVRRVEASVGGGADPQGNTALDSN